MEAVYITGGVLILILLVMAFMAFAADEESVASGLAVSALICAAAVGLIAAIVALADSESEKKTDYALYCVDGAAVVVNETYCERETRVGAFWLWVGPPPATPTPERTAAPAKGALIDCTNEDAWNALGLDLDNADLPPNGTVRQADRDDLVELGVPVR